jgi:RimJ/RimL family protein N-acetyltransferase
MTATFFARPADDLSIDRASVTHPANPFLTPSYVRAQKALGYDAWLLGLTDGAVTQTSALCLIRGSLLHRWMMIPASPALPSDSIFWAGLDSFCRERGVTNLELSTFANPGGWIPELRGETERVERTEFEMTLLGKDLWAGISKSHRERINQGRKHGLVLRRGRSEAAIDAHVALQINSMDRRTLRGENVAQTFERSIRAALLTSGAGELFQAMLGDDVVSSLLVLRSSTGAYCESSGNSAKGMKIGASHFLRYETALALQAEKIEVFYLGGARATEAGLHSYKSGFGAMAHPMASVNAWTSSWARRKLSTVARLLRDDPREVLTTLAGRPERYVAYVADPARVPPPESKPGWELRKIGDEVLTELSSARPEFRAQAARLAEGRVNDAYGLYIDEVLAGITWMIPARHDAMYGVRNVKLRAGEVELTHCITLPEFRNRGVYTFMIRSLCALAVNSGFRRVYMITNRTNVASQRGILKAGLEQTGGIHRHVFDFIGAGVAFTFRRHRWRYLGWR